MELLNIVKARAVWLLDIAELNPRGKSLFPEFFEWLKDTYHFQKIPTSITDVDETKALVFSGGEFQAREEIFVAAELKVYNDGLVADTQSSTADTERFLESVLVSASAEYNLIFRHEMIRKKLYLTELHAHSPKSLANPGLEAFAVKIAAAIPGGNPEFEFGGVSFWPRQSFPPHAVSAFHLERKLNTDRREGKYFSRAPLRSEDHLRLLNEFESEFMS